jgi:hypothetical protein
MLLQTEPVQNEVPLPLLRRQVALSRRLKELDKDNQIHFFTPHTKQELFFEAARYRFRYARTGNRFGKSEMGTAEDVAFALGYRPWYPEGHPLRTLGIPNFPTKGLIICISWAKSREIFTETEQGNLGKLWKYIPKSKIVDTSKNHSGFFNRFVVEHISGGRSVIMIDTVEGFKNNKKAQESSVHDWVHIDEPIPEEMWKSIVRGLTDRGGRAWFTCTPIDEPWIDQQFVPDLESQSKADLGTIANEKDSRWMMTGSMDDNPHLSKSDIELTLSWYTEEERETRRSGRPAAYSGIVYKEFNWNVHVRKDAPPGWKAWHIPPDDYTIRFAIDYHPRKPHHVLFIATSPQDYQYVYAEVHASCLMKELMADIKAILKFRDPTVPGLIDPLASTPNQVTDITPMEELQRLGLPLIPATKDPSNGILKVKELLSARDRSGRPLILFNPNCARTMFEISRGFVWDEDTNKPVKKNDDAMENLYRLALQDLSYVEPSSTFTSSNTYVASEPDYSNVINLSDFEEPTPRKRSVAFASRYKT